MSLLPTSHAHFQYVANFYQRKMVQPDNLAVQNQSSFDEEKFLQSGKFFGLLRAIFTAIITFDSSPFHEFVADFDASANSDNFKAVLKERVSDQQEHDEIDALTASQLAQIRDLIVLLEDNRERITRSLGMYEHYYNDVDDFYSNGGSSSLSFKTGMLTIVVNAGRAGLLIDGTFCQLISGEQFLSGRKQIEALNLGDSKGIRDISLKDALLKDARIYDTSLNRFDFSRTDLHNIKSRNTTFKEGSFDNTDLTSGNFSNVTFQDVSLQGASANSLGTFLGLTDPSHIHKRLVFENSRFQRVNLNDIYLDYATFSKVTSTDVKAANANFRHVDFTNTRFVRGDMNKANFDNAKAIGLVLDKINLSESTFKAGSFYKSQFNRVNFAMAQFISNPVSLSEDCYEHLKNLRSVHFSDSIFKDVKIGGANFEGARFNRVHISVRLDEMAELPGTLSAIKTIHNIDGSENSNLELDVVNQAKTLIATESAKQLSETLAHLKVIDDVAIKRELMECVMHRFNAIDAHRSKVESPELIAQTEELRQQILAEVSGQPAYESSNEMQDFIKMAVLKQAIFGYSQGYFIEGLVT